MVAFVFGIILLVVGIVAGIVLLSYSTEEYKEDSHGNYIRDTNGNRITEKVCPVKKFAWIGFVAGLLLFCILLFVGCTVSVDTGHTGVVTVFGRVEDITLDAGFHIKAPWQTVIELDNRVQKSTVELECFSKDIQEVKCLYTVNYQIDRQNAQTIYRTIGKDYYDKVIVPSVSESVKTVMAKYTAEELIGDRSTLARGIEEELGKALESRNIEIVATAIEDLDFTDTFTNAVEAKQVAAQNKLKAEIEQEQAVKQAEADARVAKTKAEADAAVAKVKAEAGAEVAKIDAQADREVAQIGADSAEYQGRKEAAIRLQALASVNGWTVVTNEETQINELYKASGEKVTAEELLVGTERLIKYYEIIGWDGKLPVYYVADNGSVLPILSTSAD